MANFENISRETKREAFKGDEDRLQEDTVKSPAIEIALKEKNLFAKGDDDEVEADVSIKSRVMRDPYNIVSRTMMASASYQIFWNYQITLKKLELILVEMRLIEYIWPLKN